MPTPVRIASFNIRTSRAHDGPHAWRRRRDACVRVIAGLAADVVGLQEVRPDQFADLRAAFASHALVGDGRDTDGGGEHAAVLTDWAVESAETRWLSPTPHRRGSLGWDANLPRVATLARVRRGDARNGVRLGVLNTHFDHLGVEAREHSARLLVRWLAAEPEVPWVVLGDLNDVPGSPPLQTLTEAGYTDALGAVGGGTEHAFTGATGRDRIDHILLGAGVAAHGARIDHTRPGGVLPSDHWPVVADVAIG